MNLIGLFQYLIIAKIKSFPLCPDEISLPLIKANFFFFITLGGFPLSGRIPISSFLLTGQREEEERPNVYYRSLVF